MVPFRNQPRFIIRRYEKDATIVFARNCCGAARATAVGSASAVTINGVAAMLRAMHGPPEPKSLDSLNKAKDERHPRLPRGEFEPSHAAQPMLTMVA